MFIAIYKDGNHVTKTDLEDAFSLPGNYYVFSYGKSSQLNHDDGICFYNKNRKIEKFIVNHLELVDIKGTKWTTAPFQFSIHDNNTDTIKTVVPNITQFEEALSFAVKSIISASYFQDWESYEKETKKLEALRSENKDLKDRIDILLKKIEELVDNLNSFQKL